MTPVALEVALTVQQELQSRLDETDRLRRAQVERARYEADLARRRFLRVDPENRLVADSLEKDWNEKLRTLAEAQQNYERQRQTAEGQMFNSKNLSQLCCRRGLKSRHHLVLATGVGGRLTLPVDVEPYGPGDSEYAAGKRLLRRVRTSLGARYIDDGVVDGEFATAPFLHTAGEVGWPVVARLKDNLPELFRAAPRRFRLQPTHRQFRDGSDQVEIREAEDFDPWEALRWETVRVIRYRPHHPHGETVEAYGLTHLPARRVSRRCLYAMAKNRYGLEHPCDHHPDS